MTLIEYLESCRQRRFEYGVYDCAIFVADWVQIVTGKDYAKKYRGKYTTQEAGLKKIKGDLRAYVQKALAGPFPINQAHTGDIALRTLTIDEQLKTLKTKEMIADTYGDEKEVARLQKMVVEDGVTLGIVAGHRVYGPLDTGLGQTPLSEWEEVYRA